MKSNQYKDYIKKSFIKYALCIISLLFVLVLLFLLINVQWIISGPNKRNHIQLSGILDQQILLYQKGLTELTQNLDLQTALNSTDLAAITANNRLLYDFTNAQTIRSSFILLDQSGRIVSSNLFAGNQEIFHESDIFRRMTSQMQEQPEKIFTQPNRLNYANEQKGDLILGKAVIMDGKLIGYLFFDLLDTYLYEIIREYPLDDVIITDRYDNLIFSISRQQTDPIDKYPSGKYRMDWQEGSVVKVNGKHYHIQKSSLPGSSLILYTLVSTEYQKDLLLYGIIFMLIVGILLVIISLPVTEHITQKNLLAINELQKSIEQMGKGNMDYQLRSQVFDEFQKLDDAYRHMVIQREELLKYNSELSERKRTMEIKQLEEQFNPHFIFNVMETLRYEIMIDAAKASDMVQSFARLMRYSIYYGSIRVSLRTDIEYINDYLLLQKMRYNRRLKYHIDIPEELLEYRIPKLLLQPVVENSLVHGMKNTHSISITITGRVHGDLLELCVEDNGSGIDGERLASLRAGLELEDGYKEHIGLYNSHRVVRLLYGPGYGVTIESQPGSGTRITVTMPADMEDYYV